MHKLGATLEQAQSAVKLVSSKFDGMLAYPMIKTFAHESKKDLICREALQS